MTSYYLPLGLDLTDSSEFFVAWNGLNYQISDGCPDRQSSNYEYWEINPYGFLTTIGVEDMTPTSKFFVSESCESSQYDIGVVEISRSLIDAPAYTPHYPLYFFGTFALSVFLFIFAFRLFFGSRVR